MMNFMEQVAAAIGEQSLTIKEMCGRLPHLTQAAVESGVQGLRHKKRIEPVLHKWASPQRYRLTNMNEPRR